MQKSKKNALLYLLIVILPSVLGIFLQTYNLVQRDYERQKTHAEWIASIHQRTWDQLISETVTSLDIISITANNMIDSPQEIKPLLQQVQQKDPRYGGLYLLNEEGKVITGSHSLLDDANYSSMEYIQTAIKTKDTVISNHQETLHNDQTVIGLATPVLNERNELSSILVAHLRVDYIENVMKVLTPDTNLLIVNGQSRIIMNLNGSDSKGSPPKEWLTIPIERLPWSIKAEIPGFDWKNAGMELAALIAGTLVFFHILFILVKYYLLKKQSAKEKAQIEAQKLELVGSLAASTAHEIRNPLTGIKGLVQLLAEKYREPKDLYYFSIIDEEINRINEIVSEFLILGKPTAQKKDIIDIRSVFTELKPLISSEANLHNIRCSYHFPNEPMPVECAKDQMKQVILNLIKNAFESMKNGGDLKINVLQERETCNIEIIDTGSGISEEALNKVFDPFYTSKDTGTGLGLVICKKIIQSFNGTIHITSKEQHGTKVVITLPLALAKNE
ncbi:two-component sensor histidine kinase [Bacillus sp. V3-13]|uniref:ATP-binding protein n=1 Tax=Bacillus sp. V3-13 TaxID=2053728 RepID=UPI000C78835B|nr:ATP-binding protein [Bacillus sp. V3-13]PLR76050.1 two-component sensor histidine kinase [Bacillus sp. V3-13]